MTVDEAVDTKDDTTVTPVKYVSHSCCYRLIHDTNLTAQNITVEELDILQSRFLSKQDPAWRELPTAASLTRAHAQLSEHLHCPRTPAQDAARRRLLSFYKDFDSDTDRKALLKVLNDLDLVLFHGTLRNRVYIEWYGDFKFSSTVAWCDHAHTGYNHSNRTSIHLDTNRAWFNVTLPTKHHVLGTLIHEMMHAYLFIVTGAMDIPEVQETCVCKARVVHGLMWQESVRLLASKLDLSGLEPCHIGDPGGKCHRWNDWAEFKENVWVGKVIGKVGACLRKIWKSTRSMCKA